MRLSLKWRQIEEGKIDSECWFHSKQTTGFGKISFPFDWWSNTNDNNFLSFRFFLLLLFLASSCVRLCSRNMYLWHFHYLFFRRIIQAASRPETASNNNTGSSSSIRHTKRRRVGEWTDIEIAESSFLCTPKASELTVQNNETNKCVGGWYVRHGKRQRSNWCWKIVLV